MHTLVFYQLAHTTIQAFTKEHVETHIHKFKFVTFTKEHVETQTPIQVSNIYQGACRNTYTNSS